MQCTVTHPLQEAHRAPPEMVIQHMLDHSRAAIAAKNLQVLKYMQGVALRICVGGLGAECGRGMVVSYSVVFIDCATIQLFYFRVSRW